MDVLIQALQLITGLTILVFIHEMGHFLAARAFGIRVEKFYIFFDAWGFKLISFKYKGTEYGIGWIPLGGYVKIAGMIDESMDKEQMKKPPQNWEFRSKPAWQRFIVMVGGIVMNIILGVIIFSMSLLAFRGAYLPAEKMEYGIITYDLAKDAGFKTGDKIVAIDGDELVRFSEAKSAKMLLASNVTVIRNGKEVTFDLPKGFFKRFSNEAKLGFVEKENFTFVVDSVADSTGAKMAGLMKGDRILKVNGMTTERFGYFRDALMDHKGEQVELVVDRKGQQMNMVADVSEEGTLGFIPKLKDDYLEAGAYVDYTFANSFKFGSRDAFNDLIYQSIIPFGKMFKGEIDPTKSLKGPFQIATIYGSDWNWARFWYLTGLISMVLAFMNFLPIPALDGGHVLFILVEMVSRRKLSDKFLEKAQIAGMILLLSLMVLIFGNDIFQIMSN